MTRRTLFGRLAALALLPFAAPNADPLPPQIKAQMREIRDMLALMHQRQLEDVARWSGVALHTEHERAVIWFANGHSGEVLPNGNIRLRP